MDFAAAVDADDIAALRVALPGIAEGADVNHRGAHGGTALHIAAGAGDRETLQALLDAGANPNQLNWLGRAPLWFACMHASVDCVEALLGCEGADGAREDNFGMTPLSMAAKSGSVPILGALVRAGTALDGGGHTRRTALWHACLLGHVPAVEFLLGAGADLNLPDSDKCTPLHVAAARGDMPMVETLLRAGADTGPISRDRLTALATAAVKGFTAVVRRLLEVDQDAESRTRATICALHGCHHELVSLLRQAGGADMARALQGAGQTRVEEYERYRAARLGQRYTLLACVARRALLGRHAARGVAEYL